MLGWGRELRMSDHILHRVTISLYRSRSPRCREFSITDPKLTVLASGSHMDATTKSFVDRLDSPSLKNLGSSLKMVIVAEGDGDVYPRFAPTMEWDTCAAEIIVQEAGGRMIDATG